MPVVVSVFFAAACASGPSYLDSAQADAVRMAELRAQSELGCEAGKGEVTARETLRSPPPQRVAYQVLVTGCGQRRIFIVECADGPGCFAGTGRPAR